MKLSKLTQVVAGASFIGEDVRIEGLAIDSRAVKAGDLFFCVPGLKMDGHDFAPQAVSGGAAALVVERKVDLDVPQIIVKDARIAVSLISQCFYDYPDKRMHMIGVTGTKGKTTTCFLMKRILERSGRKCGLIGTAMNMIGDTVLPSSLTTPDPTELHRLLRQMADEGCTHCVMEVSAHALTLKRVEGILYDIGLFTNFSQDHLDFFADMDEYFDAKAAFFEEGMCSWAAINADDARHVRLTLGGPHATYAVAHPADAYAREIEIREDGVSFVLEWGAVHLMLHLQLSGLFNVYNAMAAAVVCLHAGVTPEAVQEGLESVRGVPGRMEVIPTNTPYRVYLDYAHSPESLKNVLETIRQFSRGRVICLFGCGGDREKAKRPIMGEIAGELADLTIITSDNPRTEEPMSIISQIEQGIIPTKAAYVSIENRRDAIAHALSVARDGDTVILAGKGHESYQEINGVKRPFDEKQIVMDLLGPNT